jgi:hypothetical protein
MRGRPLNISAALAIAIERQVEAIIAAAKAQCALKAAAALRRGFPVATISGSFVGGLVEAAGCCTQIDRPGSRRRNRSRR